MKPPGKTNDVATLTSFLHTLDACWIYRRPANFDSRRTRRMPG